MSKLYPLRPSRVNISNITSQLAQGKKLLDRLSDAIRLKHYSYRTELGYSLKVTTYQPKRHYPPKQQETGLIHSRAKYL